MQRARKIYYQIYIIQLVLAGARGDGISNVKILYKPRY